MDIPIYKLEGVVKMKEEAAPENFVGPLDLILHLLSKNRIAIEDIKIGDILDQYLAYIRRREAMDLELASEFITMASHLMYIKTRMLLSVEDEEAKTEMDELIRSLEERQRSEAYARIKDASLSLGQREAYGRAILTKTPEPLERSGHIEYSHTAQDLEGCIRDLLERGIRRRAPVTAFDGIVMREPYPVEDKAEDILRRLVRRGVERFSRLFIGACSRSEIVATFLAVLELCRTHAVKVAGTGADCTVSRVEGGTAERLAEDMGSSAVS